VEGRTNTSVIEKRNELVSGVSGDTFARVSFNRRERPCPSGLAPTEKTMTKNPKKKQKHRQTRIEKGIRKRFSRGRGGQNIGRCFQGPQHIVIGENALGKLFGPVEGTRGTLSGGL